ncbi:MAG: V-type ATP synthase subunit E family protein [Dehalococcoidia bacterium]|nr:V-type ATP synthase subunit E family protein [Dehalococcoidia bacterium]
MEKISEAVVSKVKLDAQNIIREAEEKAQEEIEKAKRQREVRFEEERGRMLGGAEEEVARILAQASIKARQQLSSAKADTISKIIDGAQKELSQVSSDEIHFLNLIREAMEGLSVDKARIYVSPKDVSTVKKFLEADKELSGKIVEVRESNCLGGVIAENVEGKLRIDNTYETRLEMLLPKLLPKISKELFEAP